MSAAGVMLGLGLVAWELRQNTDQAVLNTRAVEVAAYQHGDMAYYKFEQGVLDLERLESVMSPLRNRLTLPGMHEEWAARRPSFAPGSQVYIDGLFDSIGG